ncbi:MAG: helix-turn-helix transcriptional regulator [Candidatus Dormibacteria bacterium]
MTNGEGTWTFLTNHGHVLLCIARDRQMRGRDIAAQVGITERAAQSLIADLVEAGYVTRSREGRRNRYELNDSLPLRHPLEQTHHVGELLRVLTEPSRPSAKAG